MDSWTFDAANEADTARLGTALDQVLPDGSVVAMTGTLGAGKTRLVNVIKAPLIEVELTDQVRVPLG